MQQSQASHSEVGDKQSSSPVFEIPLKLERLRALRDKQRSDDPELIWIHEKAEEVDVNNLFEKAVETVIERSEDFFIKLLARINDERGAAFLDASVSGIEKLNYSTVCLDWNDLNDICEAIENPTGPMSKRIWMTAIERVLKAVLGCDVTVNGVEKDVNWPECLVVIFWDIKL